MLQMESKDEKKEFFESFFGIVGSKNFYRALNEFKNKTGFGVDCISILFYGDFEEWDDYRCKENEVALIIEYPAAKEDTIGYLDFSQFYSVLDTECKKYIEKHPEELENINRLLSEIKSEFGVI
ncbi:MAG TPA: ribonuclease toxin immunity protein CdiI [Candidatus Bathyarchaeia archaeon]|nr:ribonuclease toxin immunity protein CdiI [Candidatus Bathyarchaeia archaeon]